MLLKINVQLIKFNYDDFNIIYELYIFCQKQKNTYMYKFLQAWFILNELIKVLKNINLYYSVSNFILEPYLHFIIFQLQSLIFVIIAIILSK